MLKDMCYVVRPAKMTLAEWKWVFDELLEPTAKDAGFTCVLGAIMGEPGTLLDSLISKLVQAEMVIVDISGCNDPKTFYQLGVRHARSNRTILITPNKDDIFYDFQPFYSLTYPNSPRDFPAFRRALKEMMLKIRQEPEEPDNPVQRYLSGAGRLAEENKLLHEKLDELERVAQENQHLKDKLADVERTIQILREAPRVVRPDQPIKFRPIS
jgi:hypothetical protein